MLPIGIDIDRRLARYRRLYASRAPGGLLICARFPGRRPSHQVDLREFDFTRETEHRRYWDLVVDNTLTGIANHEGLDDDWVPGIVLHYGFGAFGAVYWDADLTFTDNTSYMDRAVDDWSRLPERLYSPDRFWSRVFVDAARYLSARAERRFLVDPYPNPSPLDVVNLLIGNDLFTAFRERADELRRLLEHATDAVIENARAIQEALDNPWGGALAFNAWIPSGVLLLEDAADLCSPRTYAEYGRPYTQRVIDAFGGAYIHHHSLGRHQYRNMASLRGLHVLQISSDPSVKRPPADLVYVMSEAGGTVVDLECTAEEIYEHIGELQQGRAILRADCPNPDEAERLVRFVRQHSAAL